MPRKKAMLLVLASVVGVMAYLNFFYFPTAKKIAAFKSKIAKAQARVQDLQAGAPAVEEQRKRVKALDQAMQELTAKIEEREKVLPSKRNLSQLLGEFTRLAKGFELDSIRQRMDLGEDYSRVFAEIVFRAGYQDTVDYVKKVESISPLLRVEELEVREPRSKQAKGPGAETRLLVSVLLGERSVEQALKADEAQTREPLARDIFVSKTRPAAAVEEEPSLKLEGITYASKAATAIINGEVVREGSAVGSFTVKRIMMTSVVLADKGGEYILNVGG